MARGRYITKGQRHLLEFAKQAKGSHFTAQEVSDYLANVGNPISTTTLYRQLSKLVEEGSLKKYQLDAGLSACYEYVDHGHDCKSSHCAHLKCSQCGKLEHLSCDEVELVRSHIAEHHGFDWDVSSTVFMGVCADCAAGAKS